MSDAEPRDVPDPLMSKVNSLWAVTPSDPQYTRLRDEIAAEIADLREDRDEWEQRYDALLKDIGGVSPG